MKNTKDLLVDLIILYKKAMKRLQKSSCKLEIFFKRCNLVYLRCRKLHFKNRIIF